MRRGFIIPIVAGVALLMSVPGCMRWDYAEEREDFDMKGEGLFILCEGNFQYGNATLSYYDPVTEEVFNEMFYRANGMKLGDVAQSMTVYGGRGWIVVNNSHVIFSIDLDTFRETGRITNLTSPRYIHFVDGEKAYVSQLWDNRIFIVNPRTYAVTGYITVPEMEMESGSTEQMVQIGKYVYATCWSYQNRIIKIDTETDEVVDWVEVGVQPKNLVRDIDGRLWTMTDGGYEGSPYGYEPPALLRIDPRSLTVEKEFRFRLGDSPKDLRANGTLDTIYWINGDVWRMPVESERLPGVPLLKSRETRYYGLTVDPSGGDVYVADAIDYQQPGTVYRYSSSGLLLGEFSVGVTPGAFCWKNGSGQ